MKSITVYYLSLDSHISQILTGFHLLERSKEFQVSIKDGTRGALGFPPFPASVAALYCGKKLFYDLCDGYHDPETMRSILETCDFYFKRSFSPERNLQEFGALSHKIHPLGLNYHVSYPGNPLDKKRHVWPALCFTPKLFEGKPRENRTHPRILFYTRLWPRDDTLPEALNQEREQINAMRIQIIRCLKDRYRKYFWGGVEKSPLANELCPDLVLPKHITWRHTYLKKLHRSDICIGTTGLHGSIGWKTGEYVAAAKAVVCEKNSFTASLSFPHLSFETAEQCLASVTRLSEDAAFRLAMQEKCHQYYHRFLKPDILILNTLSFADPSICIEKATP